MEEKIMKLFGLLAVVVGFGFGCGSVQDETKKAPPAKEECKDAPGKVQLVLANDAGAPVCSGTVDIDMSSGKKGNMAVAKLGMIDGAEACGLEFTEGGNADIKAPGFSDTKASWTVPGKCEVNVIKVTLKP